jgi:hypothetical protein
MLEAARGIDVIAANCSIGGMLLIVTVLCCSKVVPALNSIAKLVGGGRVGCWNRAVPSEASWTQGPTESTREASVGTQGPGVGNRRSGVSVAIDVIKEAILAHCVGQGQQKG